MFRVGFFAILIFCLVPFQSFAKGPACDAFPRQQVLQIAESQVTLFGRTFEILRISSDQLRNGKLSASRFPFRNSVYIGIWPNGHMYAVANSRRQDGELAYLTPEIKDSDSLEEGFVVRIEDETGQIAADIEDALKTEIVPRGLTCVQATCRVFDQIAGLKLAGEVTDPILPATFLKQLIQHGFKSRDGRTVKVQFLMLGEGSLATFRVWTQIAMGLRLTSLGLWFIPPTGVAAALGWSLFQ